MIAREEHRVDVWRLVMNIRVQDYYQTTAAAEPLRADEVSRPPGTAKPAAGAATNGTDQVSLSSLPGSIGDALAVAQSQQADRVRQLAAVYASGHYQVDAGKVAHAMVAQAIAVAPGGEEG